MKNRTIVWLLLVCCAWGTAANAAQPSVKIMLVRAELDPGVMGDMLASDKALHDELCKRDGAKAKDGQGRVDVNLTIGYREGE